MTQWFWSENGATVTPEATTAGDSPFVQPTRVTKRILADEHQETGNMQAAALGINNPAVNRIEERSELSQASMQGQPSDNQADLSTDEVSLAEPDLASATEADTESNDSYLAREHLAVHTWNVRSLKSLANRDALTLHLEQHQPEILVATETWLDFKLTQIHQNY